MFIERFGTGPIVSLRQHDKAQFGEAYYFDIRGDEIDASGVIDGPGFENALRSLGRWYPRLKEPVKISVDEINRAEFWL